MEFNITIEIQLYGGLNLISRNSHSLVRNIWVTNIQKHVIPTIFAQIVSLLTKNVCDVKKEKLTLIFYHKTLAS